MTASPASPLNSADLATEIVAAYVSNNHVSVSDLPVLIRSVHDTLFTLSQPVSVDTISESLKPAVPVRRSVTDDFIISLEDGRKLKSMKRYLAGLGMTPAQYRAKWGLPDTYPMVAPSYARQRSELARTLGLGRKPAPKPAAASVAEPGTLASARKRGGRRKAA